MCQVFTTSDAAAVHDEARKKMLRVQLELLSRSMGTDSPKLGGRRESDPGADGSPDPLLPARIKTAPARDRPNLD